MSALINGKPSWKSKSNLICYSPIINRWMIDSLNDSTGYIYTSGLLLGANKTGKWMYYHEHEEMFKDIDTNDFSIECIAKKGTNQH